MMNSREYTNSEIRYIIDEYIHSARDREIMYRRLIDGCTAERLAEEFDCSPRQMQRIICKLQTKVFIHL